MKVRIMVFLAIMLIVIGPAVADEAFNATEATAIIKDLLSQAQTTWIPAGTILARHEEYRAAQTTDEAEISKEIERQLDEYRDNLNPKVSPEAQKFRIEAIPFNTRYWMSNEYTMNSTVLMRYDGSRYYYERQIDSRTDSVEVPPELKGNPFTEDFHMEWNGHRIITWDGQTYTTYDVRMDHAITEAGIGAPAPTGGPLTAGILSWGEGIFAEENLDKASVSAVSVSRDGAAQTEMTLELENGSKLSVVLDPSKDNAVTSASLPGRGGTVVQNRYFADYQQFGDSWVPTTVLIEVRDAFTDKLLRSDKWDFVLVDADIPGPETFAVDYSADTRVQFDSPLASATYNYSNLIDMDQLLAERIEYVASKTSQKPRNCATAALKYAASRLGKTIPETLLDGLVNADGQTSLHDLRQTAQNAGLRCRAVVTDVAALRDLTDCVAILHLPGQNHFVVLDRVDDRYVWLVDLAGTKMYYRVDVSLFPANWPQGTALLLSNHPIGKSYRDLSEARMKSVLGAAQGWSCTNLVQEKDTIFCAETADGCLGYLRQLWQVYGCEPAPSGTCFEELCVYQRIWECDEDISDPDCDFPYLESTIYYTVACDSYR